MSALWPTLTTWYQHASEDIWRFSLRLLLFCINLRKLSSIPYWFLLASSNTSKNSGFPGFLPIELALNSAKSVKSEKVVILAKKCHFRHFEEKEEKWLIIRHWAAFITSGKTCSPLPSLGPVLAIISENLRIFNDF